MKTKIQKQGLMLGMSVCLTLSSSGQLNENFISKISYRETSTVVYEMFGPNNETQIQAIQNGQVLPSPTGRDCLTLIEKSKYHNYNQIHNITEWFDFDRDHLMEKVLVSEESVRDDWMTPYSKLILGKSNYEIYGPNNELLYSFPKSEFEKPEMDTLVHEFTNEMAVKYMATNLDSSFLISMIQLTNMLASELDSFSYDNHGVFFSIDSTDTRYDHDLKIIFTREYNYNRTSVKTEKIIMYEPDNYETSYFPATEVVIDYMLTENNCCLRRISTIMRDDFIREINPQFLNLGDYPQIQNPENRIKGESIQLSNIAGTNNFMIQTVDQDNESYLVKVYDLNGKYLKTYSAISGKPFTCFGISTGVYLARIQDSNGNTLSTQKLHIQNSQSNY